MGKCLQMLLELLQHYLLLMAKPVDLDNYQLLSGIPPGEIESFEIFECPNSFWIMSAEVGGFIALHSQLKRPCGGIISIYTHGGKDIFVRRTEGITKTNIQVFSAPREFYAPKYKNINEDEWQPARFKGIDPLGAGN